MCGARDKADRWAELLYRAPKIQPSITIRPVESGWQWCIMTRREWIESIPGILKLRGTADPLSPLRSRAHTHKTHRRRISPAWRTYLSVSLATGAKCDACFNKIYHGRVLEFVSGGDTRAYSERFNNERLDYYRDETAISLYLIFQENQETWETVSASVMSSPFSRLYL